MLRTVKTPHGPLTYELVHTARSSVEIRVLPQGVRLFAPAGYPLRQADGFVRDRIDWIRQAQSRLNAYADHEHALYPMTDGMPVPVEGNVKRLRLLPAPRWSWDIDDAHVTLRGPDLSPDSVREQLRKALVDLATQRLKERMDYYVPLIGRSPGRVTVREQRTKWGSCSSQGNVNFNWKLIMAPPQALDYVVIHELCHLYEFNHSDRFWARVARYQPEYAQWRDFLRSGWSHPYN